MSIFQFLRILWARRLIIAAATISSLIGGLIYMSLAPPSWTATSRVVLNLLKPDPVTGTMIGGPSLKTYVATQTAMITDYSVAGKVAEDLGWLSDPGLIRAYRNRSAQDTRDFRHWLADNVIGRTTATVVSGSNIMEISYRASKPEEARALADAIRRAYMSVALANRRDDAERNAAWFSQQADRARVKLEAAAAAVAKYERENGIVMADDKTDVDTARLRTLAGAADVNIPTVIQPAGNSQAQLAAMDAQIADASKTLGPNHPQLQALRAQRASLAQVAAKEEAERQNANARANSLRAGAVQAQLNQQKAKVIGEREKLARLAQLQSEVLALRTQYDTTQARVAQLQMEAAAGDAGISTLGQATVPSAPTSPNKPLIVMGSLALGLGTGLLLALLTELFARRVRSADDLRHAVDAPMLAVISGPSRINMRSIASRATRQVNWPTRRKAVQG